MSTTISLSALKPLPGYVLVEPAPAETKTASGIYLPEGDDKPQHGKVLAVGAATFVDGQKIEPPVEKGARVIYKKWGGNDFKVGDTEYQFLKFDDLLAVIGK
ncbi:MAG: co-chaperone GroES [Candidatus Pacebacteria bacterium CG10_big_fil_rev_8_21_14_0_10_56_10]|nr:MAG: co-chaperone GroES [Candidatus Pacebacteria bacterium CG10_big_fil_rev_8_21_14_0_10_56_10]